MSSHDQCGDVETLGVKNLTSCEDILATTTSSTSTLPPTIPLAHHPTEDVKVLIPRNYIQPIEPLSFECAMPAVHFAPPRTPSITSDRELVSMEETKPLSDLPLITFSSNVPAIEPPALEPPPALASLKETDNQGHCGFKQPPQPQHHVPFSISDANVSAPAPVSLFHRPQPESTPSLFSLLGVGGHKSCIMVEAQLLFGDDFVG